MSVDPDPFDAADRLGKGGIKEVPFISRGTCADDPLGDVAIPIVGSLRHLGSGQMGEVFLCRVPFKDGAKHRSALKIIAKPASCSDDKEALRSLKFLMREIRLHSSVCHPNVINVLRCTQSDSHVYIFLEYARKGDLFSYIERHGALDEPTAAVMAWQLMCAVEAVHNAGIIHRDIKPENVLLAKNLDVKLADFGMAARMTPETPMTSSSEASSGSEASSDNGSINNNNNNTNSASGFGANADRAGGVGMSLGKALLSRNAGTEEGIDQLLFTNNTPCGSPTYAAPEVFRGAKYGPEVDMWSFGATLYAMIAGSSPWVRSTEFHALPPHVTTRRILSADFSPLPSGSSEELHDVIRRLLCVDPKKRMTLEELKTHAWFRVALPDWAKGVLSEGVDVREGGSSGESGVTIGTTDQTTPATPHTKYETESFEVSTDVTNPLREGYEADARRPSSSSSSRGHHQQRHNHGHATHHQTTTPQSRGSEHEHHQQHQQHQHQYQSPGEHSPQAAMTSPHRRLSPAHQKHFPTDEGTTNKRNIADSPVRGGSKYYDRSDSIPSTSSESGGENAARALRSSTRESHHADHHPRGIQPLPQIMSRTGSASSYSSMASSAHHGHSEDEHSDGYVYPPPTRAAREENGTVVHLPSILTTDGAEQDE